MAEDSVLPTGDGGLVSPLCLMSENSALAIGVGGLMVGDATSSSVSEVW